MTLQGIRNTDNSKKNPKGVGKQQISSTTMFLYQPHQRIKVKLISRFVPVVIGEKKERVKNKNLKIWTTAPVERRPVQDHLLKRFCSFKAYPQVDLQWCIRDPSAGSQTHTRSLAQQAICAFSSFPSFVIGIYSKLMNQSKLLYTYLRTFQKSNLHFRNGWKSFIQSGITTFSYSCSHTLTRNPPDYQTW